MDDLHGLFAKDFGIKPQGKSAPMAPPRNTAPATSSFPDFGLRSDFGQSSYANSKSSNPIFDDHDRDGNLFNDFFGGPPKYSQSRASSATSSSVNYDSIFKDEKPKYSSVPAYDKPVYNDDIFDSLPGLKSSSASSTAKYDHVFASTSSQPQTKSKAQKSSPFDDLLGSIGRKQAEVKRHSQKVEKDAPFFDDLIPGFGGRGSPLSARSTSESKQSQKPFSNSTKAASNFVQDPFVVLEPTSTRSDSSAGLFTDPLEEISELNGSVKPRMGSRLPSDDIDPVGSLGQSVPPVRSESNNRGNDRSPLRTASVSGAQTSDKENNEGYTKRRMPSDEDVLESAQTVYDMPNVSANHRQPSGQTTSPWSYTTSSNNNTSSHVNSTQGSVENSESFEDIWLTVSEVPLFTQPTSAPPPSRPPPPRPPRVAKSERGLLSSKSAKKSNNFSSSSEFPQYSHSSQSVPTTATSSITTQIDELGDFAMGVTKNNANPGALPREDFDTNSVAAASAAAMKEAVDIAEPEFRHAKEMQERDNLRASRNRDHLDKDENLMQDAHDRELKERRERLERERQQREKEEQERERAQSQPEKERERALELERERQKARQAVERATREARERAAADARARAEKAAVEKAAAEARERAERAAVQRAQAEARERAAAEARERAEKAAAEAREMEAQEKAKAESDARLRAERAAVERVAAEARERAAAEARERAARASQQKNVNDLDFSMGQASSAPRPRSNSSDPLFDTQNKTAPESARRTSVGSSSSVKKPSSTANILDDLTSIFGDPSATSSAGEFREIDGESEERRRARMERHQRTQERAAKALAEKNQRDLEAQREQAERHRIAETLDIEIKRWAAGKEGNLRALLSTLQYVLWPECGWQAVSLTDLITAAAVKKVYRKATLCIHPDKVQQKGASLQQKYIAEKVFDLLKEAWNKFNSEELF